MHGREAACQGIEHAVVGVECWWLAVVDGDLIGGQLLPLV